LAALKESLGIEEKAEHPSLGLEITRSFADLLGGKFQITSRPGLGKVHHLFLPGLVD
jgi:two-component sensor histidine kinase